jgi:hypothetical protein
MNLIEKELLDNLLALETAAAKMATANPKPDLIPIFSRLDELARQLPAGTDPELRHFLQRKSYQKARVLLEQLQTGSI